MGEAKNPFVCPSCGNTNLEDMRLLLTSIQYENWYTDADSKTDDGLPVFFFGTATYTEMNDGIEPRMECLARLSGRDRWDLCYERWTVDWDDFDLI